MLWHARLCAAVFTAADIKLRSPLLPTVSSPFSTKKLIFAAKNKITMYLFIYLIYIKMTWTIYTRINVVLSLSVFGKFSMPWGYIYYLFLDFVFCFLLLFWNILSLCYIDIRGTKFIPLLTSISESREVWKEHILKLL